jgi:hypothetical protein
MVMTVGQTEPSESREVTIPLALRAARSSVDDPFRA